MARQIATPGRTWLSRSGIRVAAASLAMLTTAAVVACSAPAPIVVTPPPVTVTPTIDASRTAPPAPVVPIVWPLTGVPTAEVAARPAIAVKIENTSAARPQSGLQAADVVWETIVEFEVSRLVAVFHSQLPDEIGPIRSVRPMDIPIASPLHGPFVFSGGQAGIVAMVNSSVMQPISHDAGADGLYRASRRPAPHNVYASLTTVLAQVDANHAAVPAQQFAFAPRPALAGAIRAGTPATSLSFTLSGASHPSWAWDAARAQWLRSEGSTPATDFVTGAQIGATNVVSIVANHPPSGFVAQNNASVPTYELIGEGDCVVATGGMTIAGRWRKASDTEPMQLFTADGQPLLLAPGNTWVELVPLNGGSLALG